MGRWGRKWYTDVLGRKKYIPKESIHVWKGTENNHTTVGSRTVIVKKSVEVGFENWSPQGKVKVEKIEQIEEKGSKDKEKSEET